MIHKQEIKNQNCMQIEYMCSLQNRKQETNI